MNHRIALSGLLVLSSLALGACSNGDSADDPAGTAGAGGAGGGGSGGAGGGASPVFYGQVDGIIQTHCQNCHRDGGLAPFPLGDYAAVKGRGESIKSQMQERKMPPWGADDTADCKPPLGFKGDLRVPQADIDLVARWLDEGAAAGDPARATPTPAFQEGGLVGVTDKLPFQQPYTVAPGGGDQFVCFVIDPKITETTYVNGIFVVAGNALVDHHALVFTDPSRESLKKADASGKYDCFGGPDVAGAALLTAWAPGVPPSDFGDRAALEIPKDSVFIVQMHYHPLPTEAQTDQTAIHLRKVDKKPEQIARVRLLGNAQSAGGPIKLLPDPDDRDGKPEFRIPAGAKAHTETMEFTLPKTAGYSNVRLAAIGAHMHWIGRDLRVELFPEGGTSDPATGQCLLETPRYDFNWQRAYSFDAADIEQLPLLKGGDTLRITCTYDNTMDNPGVVRVLGEKHLTSPVDVTLGETTLDEMCLGAFTFITPSANDDPGGPTTLMPPAPACDVSPIPDPLPTIKGTFGAYDEAKGQAPPAVTGGDPTGLWFTDSLEIFLTGQAASVVNTDASVALTTGFYDFRADGTYRLRVYSESSIVTGVAGTLSQTTDKSSTGTYAVAGSEIVLTPSCPSAPPGTTTSFDFSVAGDTLTLESSDTSAQAGKTFTWQTAKRH
jgi:hypothetical protein